VANSFFYIAKEARIVEMFNHPVCGIFILFSCKAPKFMGERGYLSLYPFVGNLFSYVKEDNFKRCEQDWGYTRNWIDSGYRTNHPTKKLRAESCAGR
jgi:hypothetical protein